MTTFFDTETDKTWWYTEGYNSRERGYIFHADIESESDYVNNNRLADSETNQTVIDIDGLTIIDSLPINENDYAWQIGE